MRKIMVAAGLVLPIVATTVFTSDAFARQPTRYYAQQMQPMQRMSFEDAWSVCKKFVDDARLSWDAHGQRYTRGGACMYMHGYRVGGGVGD